VADQEHVPTHKDMPDGWHKATERRVAETDIADERARDSRKHRAPNGAPRRLTERQAIDEAREATSVAPPGT
jgi:hypothetical protein